MTYPVKLIRNARISMPDCVGQRMPAIIMYTPYQKVSKSAYDPRATRYTYFASQGCVFVNFDIRGTDDSGGFMVGDSILPGQSTAAVALGGLRVAGAVMGYEL